MLRKRTAIVVNGFQVAGRHILKNFNDKNWNFSFIGHGDFSVDRSFESVDCLFLNSYSRVDYRASIEEFPIEHWKTILDRSVTSNFLLTKTIWIQMQRQHFGRIFYLVSRCSFPKEKSMIRSFFSVQFDEDEQSISPWKSASIVAHQAMLALSQSFAVEGAPFGITSNTICFNSNSIDQRFLHHRTLSDLIEFLSSNAAQHITGQTINWNKSLESS